ncbi:hypothetical protein ACLOAV_009247 [Pseudogymnoascus australis]
MKPARKPVATGMSDIETIDPPDELPSPQPNKGDTISPIGTIYIEAQVKPDYTGNVAKLTAMLEAIFNSEYVQTIQIGHEIIGAASYAECFFPDCLKSLKAVDIVGAEDGDEVILTKRYTIEINSYKLEDRKVAETLEALSLCGEAMLLPSVRLDGAWESLIFDEEIKQNLIVSMANILRFSYRPGRNPMSVVNRLILLSGPPGTGKTSLSTSLAQKLSIRMNKNFGETILFQLNAATLLSHYFGQSAVKIHSIFEALAAQSAELPNTLMVLLIDEIESLAASRETASARSEVHDAVRATNALLTGFDMVTDSANVFIICTSNLISSLDAAFVDRCSRHINIPQPSSAARYEILRHGINRLVECEIIKSLEIPLPTFVGAKCRLPDDYKTAGCALRRLAHKLEDNGPNGQLVSARWLSQLAGIALANNLEPNAICTVDDAVQLMSQYAKESCRHQLSKRSRTQGAVAAEYDNPAKKSKFQPERVPPDLEENLESCASELEKSIDGWIAVFREERLIERYKPSLEEMEEIFYMVRGIWNGCSCENSCYCYKIIDNRIREYVEDGTPMHRGDSN